MNKELQQTFETMGYELSDLHSLEDYEWDLVFENISKIKNNNLIVLEAHDLYNTYHKKSYFYDSRQLSEDSQCRHRDLRGRIEYHCDPSDNNMFYDNNLYYFTKRGLVSFLFTYMKCDLELCEKIIGEKLC